MLSLLVTSALDSSNCKEFKAIPPSQYDRNTSSASEKDKRPLGFMFGIAEFPTVQSDVKNPCAVLKNLTGRYVEVLVSKMLINPYAFNPNLSSCCIPHTCHTVFQT